MGGLRRVDRRLRKFMELSRVVPPSTWYNYRSGQGDNREAIIDHSLVQYPAPQSQPLSNLVH
jgi:hypothetical protein